LGAFDHLTGAADRAGNPFSDQPGTPPPALVGRDRHLRRVLAMMEQIRDGANPGALFLPGPRGLGKTSLLVETGREADGHDIGVARLELVDDRVDAAEATVGALSDALDRPATVELAGRVTGIRLGPVGIELADPDATTSTGLTRLVIEVARTRRGQGGLLLLVDEAQEHPATAAALVRAWHRAAQDGLPIGLVLAGLPGVQAAIVDQVSYAERIPAEPLGPLTDGDAFDAIAAPLAAAGIALTDTRRPHVYTVTGGYPYFVQILGRELWRALDDPDQVTNTAFTRAVRAASTRIDQWLADRITRIPFAQRAYLRAASRLGWPASTGDIAAALDRPTSSLSAVRAALLDDGVLFVPDRGLVDLVIPPLAGWLDRNPPT